MTSTHLHLIQHAFQNFILNDDPAAMPFFGKGALPGIYYTAYRVRLFEVICTEFEVLRKYLGPDEFDLLAQAYVTTKRSTFRDARDYAAGFPKYLSAQPGVSTLIRNIAGFEWALREAFDAPDEPVFTIADMAAIDPVDWADLVFSFQMAVQILTCDHAVAGLWQDASLELDQKTAYLIWRTSLRPMFRAVDALEAQVLEAARGGMNFAGLCSIIAAQTSDDDAPGLAASMLRNWVEPGLITHVSMGADQIT